MNCLLQYNTTRMCRVISSPFRRVCSHVCEMRQVTPNNVSSIHRLISYETRKNQRLPYKEIDTFYFRLIIMDSKKIKLLLKLSSTQITLSMSYIVMSWQLQNTRLCYNPHNLEYNTVKTCLSYSMVAHSKISFMKPLFLDMNRYVML